MKIHLSTRMFILDIVLTVTNLSCSAGNEDSIASDKDIIFRNTMVRMTWQEVKAAADKKAIVLVPISVVEEHGPHIELSSDIVITSFICSEMKLWLEEKGIPTVIAPPYYWGINISTGSFPGSFCLKESTMTLVISEIIDNMNSWGFERFYFVNLHGDPSHISAVKKIAAEINRTGKMHVFDVSNLPSPTDCILIPHETSGMYASDYHAGANETKALSAIEPSAIRFDKIKGLKPQEAFFPLGYAGDPANYKKSNGDIQFKDYFATFLAQKIQLNELKPDSLKTAR